MGQKGSYRIIDYEQARQWMARSGNERLIRDAFRRLAVNGHLDKETFRTGFLGSANLHVPHELSNSLFNAFDVRGTGQLTLEDFTCGLAVLNLGGNEAKTRLLFNIYDVKREGQVTSASLRRFEKLLSNDPALVSVGRFSVPSTMDFQQFYRWVQRQSEHPLVSWIYDLEARLSDVTGYTPSELEPPLLRTMSSQERTQKKEVDELVEVTGLDESEVIDLCTTYNEMRQASKHGVVDEAAMKLAVTSIPAHVQRRLVSAIDQTGSGTLALREFVVGIAICLVGTDGQRKDLCERLFSNDGEITVDMASALQYFAQSGIEVLSAWREEDVPTMNSQEKVADMSWVVHGITVVSMLGWLFRIDLHLQPPNPREERMIVDSYYQKFDPQAPGPVGTRWYILPSHWWQRWCAFTGADNVEPPSSPSHTVNAGGLAETRSSPQSQASHDTSLETQSPQRFRSFRRLAAIDSSALLDASGRLEHGLHHRQDYELLPEACWQVLDSWYKHTGSELPCHVIDLDGVPTLEVYPLRFEVWKTDSDGNLLDDMRTLECSRITPMDAVKEEASAIHSVHAPTRLFQRVGVGSAWELVLEEGTPFSLGLEGHSLLLDLSPTGARDKEQSGSNSVFCVGLQNLGNTCYMNAALQCLLHLRLLNEYFDAQYLYDLHPETKRSIEWGMAGKLAVAFADLRAEISLAVRRSVAPDQVRNAMCRFKPEFHGWEQQDAQEFLAALLEGLGEDLNRVSNKPYIELQDSGDREDSEVASEYWDAQVRRDWSIISALFTGQFKSTLCCNICGARNAKFESFSIVQVPLPEHDYQWVTCTMVEIGPRQKKVCVRVPKNCSVIDVTRAAAGVAGCLEEDVFAAEIVKGYIFARLSKDAPFDGGVRTHLFHSPAHDTPEQRDELLREFVCLPESTHECVLVNCVHRRLKRTEKYFLNPYRPELFATPQLVKLRQKSKAEEIYLQIWRCVRLVVPDYMPPKASYPFVLKRVTPDGSACCECGWRQGCLGHAISCDSQLIEFGAEDTLALDWDSTVLADHYNERSATAIAEHESVELANIERHTPEQLDKCLEALLQEETLIAYCSSCTKKNGEYMEASQTKEFRIWALPPVLVFQLKRFRNVDGRSYKLENLVNFPFRLDAAKYLDAGPSSVAGATISREKTGYSLHGVVNHSGGVGRGHYTACVLMKTGQWCCCNDERCHVISEKDVVTAQAYLLFYVREDIEGADLSQIFPCEVDSEPANADAIRKASWPSGRPNPEKRQKHSSEKHGHRHSDCVVS